MRGQGTLSLEDSERLHDLLGPLKEVAGSQALLCHIKIRTLEVKLEELWRTDRSDFILKQIRSVEREQAAVRFKLELLLRRDAYAQGHVSAGWREDLNLRGVRFCLAWIRTTFSPDDMNNVSFLVLVANAAIFALYGLRHDAEDLVYANMVFPPIYLLEIALAVRLVGPREFVTCTHNRESREANLCDLVLVVPQLVIFLLWCVALGQGDHVSERSSFNVELFMLSLVLFRIITSTPMFQKVVAVLASTVWNCYPIMIFLLAVCFEYSAVGLQVFRDKPACASDTGNLYFSDFTRSVFTHFQLFIGEGWHDIMFNCMTATNSAALYYFVSYVVLVTLLFGNLFLGVIIDVYQEANEINSVHLHKVLMKSFRHLAPEERETSFTQLAELLEELELLPDPYAFQQELDVGMKGEPPPRANTQDGKETCNPICDENGGVGVELHPQPNMPRGSSTESEYEDKNVPLDKDAPFDFTPLSQRRAERSKATNDENMKVGPLQTAAGKPGIVKEVHEDGRGEGIQRPRSRFNLDSRSWC